MKSIYFWKQDFVIATLIGLSIWIGGIWLSQRQANNYFEVTATNIWTHGTAFLTNNQGYFNELVPTKNGLVIALPPLPIIPNLFGQMIGMGEIQMTRMGIGITVGLIYLIMRYYKLSKWRAILASFLYFVTTPLLFFFVNPGYWFSAQVWGIVGAQIALLSLLKKNYTWAGTGSVIALLSRLNLGIVIIIGFALYILKYQRAKNMILYLIPTLCGLLVLMWWNYYRFGSIFTSGYELIPGVLTEPWYSKGIMHWSYVWDNFKKFAWQRNLDGGGLGMLWAQPYLLLLPWVFNKNTWWIILIGLAQFVLVLSHGYWGAYQFDFRFLMDSLWLFVPTLLVSYTGWKQWAIWVTFAISAGVHLTLISRFM